MTAQAAILSLLVLGAVASANAQPAQAAQPAPSTAAAAAAAVKPGLWETTTVIEDAASASRRSIVGRICVQPSDASTVQKILPVQRERGMQCENRDIKREGTGWAWTVSCRSRDATLSGVGRMALAGDGYVGRAELDLRQGGARAVKVKQTFSGKWIQACS